MKKWVLIILAVVMGIIGGFLAGGYGHDDRGVAWHASHLHIIKSQLLDIKDLLREYRREHGRYPTNDEGLAVLDNYDARFEAAVLVGPPPSLEGAYPPQWPRFFWELIQRRLREHRQRTGSPVSSARELRLASPVQAFRNEPDAPAAAGTTLELAVTKRDNLLVLAPAGILTPWMEPYVYENRNGHPPEVFADSPANRDGSRRYSIEVDEGIWVYTLEGERHAAALDREWRAYHGPRLVGAGMILATLIFLLFLLGWRKWAMGGLLVASGAGVSALAAKTIHATCYIPGSMFSQRSPQAVARRQELLEKYRAAGVISEETYRKATSTSQPASAPGDAD